MVSVKQRALLALRDQNPFKFINDLARVEDVRIEMRVERRFDLWLVELECESQHDPSQFYALWRPMERQGYLHGCGTSTSRAAEPLRLGLDNFVWMVNRPCRNHHLSLVFPASKIQPPRSRPENIVHYEVKLPADF